MCQAADWLLVTRKSITTMIRRLSRPRAFRSHSTMRINIGNSKSLLQTCSLCVGRPATLWLAEYTVKREFGENTGKLGDVLVTTLPLLFRTCTFARPPSTAKLPRVGVIGFADLNWAGLSAPFLSDSQC